MTDIAAPLDSEVSKALDYGLALRALRSLPDCCATDLDDLANRLGTKKLTLIGWLRADLQFARLVGAKVRQ
jgi:hypothetical protein